MIKKTFAWALLSFSAFSIGYADTATQSSPAAEQHPSSYMPVVINETFQTILQRMSAAKDAINKRQHELLHIRYDLK